MHRSVERVLASPEVEGVPPGWKAFVQKFLGVLTDEVFPKIVDNLLNPRPAACTE